MTFTVLLTSVGGELAPQVVQMLKENDASDVKVVGVDADPEAIGRHFCDQFFLVPRGDHPEYIVRILEILDQLTVDLIVPTSDEEALAMSSSREQLEQRGRLLACTAHDTLRLLINKAETYRQLEAMGVHVPDWREVSGQAQLRQVVNELVSIHGEVVIKPLQARGGRGVYVVSHAIQGIVRFSDKKEIHSDLDSFLNELVNQVDQDSPMMVMERLAEPVYDLDLLAWEGEPIRVVARRRVNSAVPNEGHKIVENPELYVLGRKLIQVFQLSWLYDCDVMYDKQGRPCVLEVNPRQSGSVSVSVAAGVPLMNDLVSLARGMAPKEVLLPVGKQVIPYKVLRTVN